MLTLLEEKREALISQAVTRGLDPNVSFKRSGLDWLGDIPQHWNIRRLKFLVQNLEQGSSPQASNIPAEPDELGILKLSAVYKGEFLRHENKALQQADDAVIHTLSLRLDFGQI
jgi:type I restriction enzyme S subunit